MTVSKHYLCVTIDEPQHKYITPLDVNSELKEQLADIIDEGQYIDIHATVEELSNGEVAKLLIDSDNIDYTILHKENTQKLIDRKDNAIEDYGEGAYDNPDYHDVIIHEIASGHPFKSVPKEQAIMRLLETNN